MKGRLPLAAKIWRGGGGAVFLCHPGSDFLPAQHLPSCLLSLPALPQEEGHPVALTPPPYAQRLPAEVAVMGLKPLPGTASRCRRPLPPSWRRRTVPMVVVSPHPWSLSVPGPPLSLAPRLCQETPACCLNMQGPLCSVCSGHPPRGQRNQTELSLRLPQPAFPRVTFSHYLGL